MAHHSAAPATSIDQQHSSADARTEWRYRNFVEDSEASDAEVEPEEFPGGKIDIHPSDSQLGNLNSFDSVPQLPELTKSGLELQQQLIRLFPPVPNLGADLGNHPPGSFDFAPQFPGFIRSQLEVQQQRPKNAFVSNLTAGRTRKNHPPDRLESVATELLAESFKLPQRSPPEPAFNSVGRLARDNPIIMTDDSATQQAILPPTHPRAKITLSDFDRTDILCILTPTTPAAYSALELVAETAEHHILQYYKKGSTPDATTSTDPIVVSGKAPSKPKAKPSLDIALRMSSVIISPAFGFVFGRDRTRSDLLISKIGRVSGRHFRIYVNPSGSLMCQDTSTNGTHVDSQLLRKRCLPTDFGDQITLHSGSVIEIQVDEYMESMRFIVQVPDRSGVSVLYGSKLNQYIDFMDQMKRRRQAEQNRMDNGFPVDTIPAPLPQFGRTLHGNKLSARANRALVAGTEPYNHGMLWNGGDGYHVTAVLGKGAFATVYKLARRADGELFAAKEIEKKAFAKGGVLDRRVDQELNIIKQLQHDNIVRYIEHHDTPECLYILMELVPGGDLQTVLQTQHLISEFAGQSVASQMCEALKYLHDRNITHRDIKPDNILIQSSDPYVFKLSDFGLSKVVEDNKTFLNSFCGTYLYCAPEVYPGYHQYVTGDNKPEPKGRRAKGRSSIKPKPMQPYTTAVDTWSLAAVLYHLLCGDPPYTGSTQDYGARILDSMMSKSVDYGKLLRVGVSRDAIDFISKMLVIDPSMRMSDNDCLAHPFVLADKRPKEISEESEDLELQTQAAARPTGHTIRDDARTEENSQTNFERLASQLSINDARNKEDLHDMDELSSEYLEDIGEMIEDVGPSEPKTRDQRELDAMSDPSFEEYIHQYPSGSQVQAAQQRQGNNLFGQISPAALRSSGTLGREARRALEIASQNRAGSSADEFPYAGSSPLSATDFPNPPNLPKSTHPGHNMDFGQAAPSLLGAESMVDKLHMDSIMADVADLDTDKQRPTSRVPGAEEHVLQAGKHQSIRSDDDLYTATPPRSRRRLDEPSSDLRESKRIRIHDMQLDPGTIGFETKPAETTKTNPMGNKQPAITGDGSTEQNTSKYAAAIPTKQTTNLRDLISATKAPASTSSSSTTKAVSVAIPAPTILPLPATPAISSPFAPPPPPSLIDYGTLTTTPDSIPFPAITLEQRLTTFGRHPACDHQWPSARDTRVPKFAFDIAFWRRGLERSLEQDPHRTWQNDKELQTIIHTRTSAAIWVNGTILTKAAETGKVNYGVLRTGDVVCVFQGKECLQFRVEIRIGTSKQARKQAGEAFEVVTEDEKDGGASHGTAPEGQGGGEEVVHGAELDAAPWPPPRTSQG
ncbi:MAG: hypothetical protein Q9182_005525 [Xanthomendoza sp. 2 TL-2023]